MEALFGQFWDKTILRQGMSHGNKDEGLSTKLRDIIDLKKSIKRDLLREFFTLSESDSIGLSG